jgi:hypothetical protein
MQWKQSILLLKYDTSGWKKHARDVLQHVTQNYPLGLLETIAEFYAQSRGGGTGQELDLRVAYPETTALLERLFKELRI